ncbi:MAG TPA: trypsin-like peptidase domain-containing protein [Polyangia bacterium]|nr:trypsin-like peptidase domain-containing protein [Polyangia bacterium]
MARDRTGRRARVTSALLATAALALGACGRPSRPAVAGAARPDGVSVPRPDGAAVTAKLEPTAEAQALSNAFAGAAKAIRSSVVRIDVEGLPPDAIGPRHAPPDLPDFLRRFFDQEAPATPPSALHGTGSGVIVDAAGDVLTNGHVVRGARKVTLELADQRKFSARVVGTDPLTDVGVVRFEGAPPGLVAARLGDSDKLRIGEWTIAVGSPLGMDQTVTVGIISAVGATGTHFRFESGERVRKYIQTDAKINPGNSGGPLVNLEGEVVGINTLINVGPGGSYGFAIPINQAWQVAGVLIKDGHVRYPYIGVSVSTLGDVPKSLRDRLGGSLPPEGAYVGSVAPGSPADGAGLEAGDVITKIGGRAVKTGSDVVTAISELRIGSTVALVFARDGRAHTIDVKVRDFPAERAPTAETGPARFGIALQTLTDPLASSLGLAPDTRGAVVTEVAPGSAAEKAAVAPGDVILEIDKQPVTTAEDAVALIHAGKGPRLLRVTNASGARYVTLAPD